MKKTKTEKESDTRTLGRIKKEMALPRVTKSVRSRVAKELAGRTK